MRAVRAVRAVPTLRPDPRAPPCVNAQRPITHTHKKTRKKMATGYIEISLILLPIGLFGQPLNSLLTHAL